MRALIDQDVVDFLIVGDGGREAAIADALGRSPRVGKIYVAGTSVLLERFKKVELIGINKLDINGLADFAKANRVHLTFPGPEAPLAAGIANLFWKLGLPLVGPSQAATRAETNKIWALRRCEKYGVPTGWFCVFRSESNTLEFVRGRGFPIVIKYPYLAEGKGSFVCFSEGDANFAVSKISELAAKNNIPTTFLVMEFLEGEEASITLFTDGKNEVYLPASQDHKHLYEGDQGPMTGGMGAYAPAPIVTPQVQKAVHEQIALRFLRGLEKEGIPYTGCLYIGGMITKNGPIARVVEFNCRPGDPEAQVVLPLVENFAEILIATWNRTLDNLTVKTTGESAACVVVASENYPDTPVIGRQISDIGKAEDICDNIYPSGIARKKGRLVTNGGRIAGMTALEDDLPTALDKATAAADAFKFTRKQFRRDIGWKARRLLEKRR
ncbi:phosphoribosylamine--glycine ligase [bacterium]|jgi:phosphoribosylamine--glycine ligase|nr:phosphoribosylamine--glycine ligase [bacterium]MDP6756322.1 phosphoribosylamine--glycine ligase [Patescibacteria group bacterium]|tara:strand:+ start:7252 stop:8571 length:1320 start_codon:yes stop_codon:yes gene_type:complete